MKIYVIIVTYNAMRREWIDRCLQSLEASTVPVEAIVVDNLSTDGTREYVPTKYPNVIWFPQEKNLGFGQANNVGLRYALDHGADYVMLLNQDASIAPDTIQVLIHAIGNRNILLSPIQLNGDGTRIDHMFNMTLHNADNSLLDDLLITTHTEDIYPTGPFAAACWFMPSAIIREIGGFCPLFFHYGEDDDYQFRMQYHGYRNYVTPKAFIYHDRGMHGNITMYNKNKVRRELLICVCNINLSTGKILYRIFIQLIKCYIQYLPCKQYRIGTFTLDICWLLTHCRSICRARKKNKKKGETWL